MGSNTIKILAIDDNQDNLISIKALLKDAFPDATTLTASSGPKGLELAATEDPDVILLDIVMPGMDGFEVCKKLKADKKLGDIPVVFVTAIKGDKESRIRALESGAEAFLVKPIDESELTAQIRAMVKIRTSKINKHNEKERLAKMVKERTSDLEQAQKAILNIVEDLKKENEARRKSEEKLRESEEKYRLIADNTDDLIYWMDPSGNLPYISPSCQRLTGYMPEEFINNPKLIDEIVYQEDIEIYKQHSQVLFKENPPDNLEFRIVTKTGEILWIQHSCGSIFTEDGKYAGRRGTNRNIAGRKLAEKMLKESEDRFRKLASFTFEGIIIHNNAIAIDVNQSTVEMLGYERDEIVGKNLFTIIHPDSHALVKENLTKEYAIPYQIVIMRKDGSTFDAEIEARNISYNGEYFRVACIRDITERKLAEQALLESEQKFRSYIEYAPDGVFVSNEKGNYVEVNSAACKITGYSENELLKVSIPDLFLPEDLEIGLQHFRDVKEKGFARGDNRFITKDGEVRFWNVAAVKLSDTRFLGFVQDITQRKRAEEEVKQSQLLSKTIIDSIPGTFYMIDTSGKYCGWNTYQRNEIVGKPESEMVGVYAIDTIHPDDREIIGSKIENVLMNGVDEVVEGRVLFRGGPDFRWFLMTGRRMMIKDSPVLIGTGIDITKRKQAEIALQEKTDLLQRVFDSNFDLLALSDLEGNFTLVGKSHEILGYNNDFLVGKNVMAFVHPEDIETVSKEFSIFLNTGEKRKVEYRYKCFDGTYLWFETAGTILRDEKGKPEQILFNTRNITERKQAEEERQKLQMQFNQAQKMESVGRLAGGVAHDFNNMLSVILGNTELILDELPADSSLHQYLTEIKTAAKRSAELTKQLLAFARKQTVAPVMVDLNQAVEKSLKMLRRLIGEDIMLTWQPVNSLWAIKIDPTQIDQVLANLCVNARDAINGVGKLSIETANKIITESELAEFSEISAGEYVMLSVADNGCGMDKEVLDRLFEPFFTTKELGKGTGLGLATVYGIVKQNLGSIHVLSEVGKGTVFELYFPRHDETETEQADEEKEKSVRGSGTVLLVEDEESIMRMAKNMLTRLGYKVMAAVSVEEALQLVEGFKGKIDLVVSDVVMPRMNGKELVTHLQKYQPEMKSLYMSGYTADVIARQGVLEKGLNFIQKPFTIKELGSKVQEIMKKEMHNVEL